VTFFIIISLVTGSSLLMIALDDSNSIPLGTFITWAGMIALPLSVYWGIKELRKPSKKLNRILAGFIKIIIILGILWVPISYLLAGNLSFSLSYGIGIGSILTIIIYWISLIFKKNKTVANNV